ncbi:MAG: Arabinose operon regulatory protein [Smithella sp. PtaU1.Bin162]|nr:MAG: Arabinose operon regulatory protein [Smithella sp. PtaU1.Bin162]
MKQNLDYTDYYYNPDIRLLYCDLKTVDNWRHANLSSGFWRLYYNFDENSTIKTSHEEYILTPAKLFLISPGVNFSTGNTQAMTQLFFHFLVASPFNTIKSQIIIFPIDPVLKMLIDKIVHTVKTETVHSVYFGLQARVLISILLSLVPREKIPAIHGTNRKIIEILMFIEKKLPEPISNEVMAKHVNMSTNAFIRLFKKETGDSPQNYLKFKRVQKASLLLKYSNLTIDEIALTTGFCDRYYFSKIFKKICDVSPAKFRKTKNILY